MRTMLRGAMILGVCVAGCAPVIAPHGHASSTLAQPGASPSGAPREPLAWADFSPETFAKAKAERRFLIMDGSAEWCHWCHVMEATSYHDPSVRKLLDEHFIAVKVDVDSRPDIEERYGAWGWPATVIFSPDAQELGKYRGYIAPEDFAEILRDVVASGAKAASGEKESPRGTAPKTALPEEMLGFVERWVSADLDEYYDEKQGGWGRTQKAPLAWDNAWALARAAAGDTKRREQALFTLEAQRGVIDPVWGGIYQYSTDGDWQHPHFEKLMPYEAGALDNYAAAYLLTGDAKLLDTAQALRRYIDTFLRGPAGGFYATQDADLNAHDRSKPYLTGHEYYAKGDAERRALGIPRVDTHEYARDNGLAIAAYATLYEATCKSGTCDASVLATAKTAAERILSTHAGPKGGVTHDAGASSHGLLHLGDNAAFAWGLARLYEASKDASYAKAAQDIVSFMLGSLGDEDGGGFFESTVDPDAVGVFAQRRVPFEENVLALRVLAKLAWIVPVQKEVYARAIDRTLRRIVEATAIKSRGRMIGDFLLALEETKGVRGVAR
jgi:uncharacterized protein YyaL (SSP411 family)